LPSVSRSASGPLDQTAARCSPFGLGCESSQKRSKYRTTDRTATPHSNRVGEILWTEPVAVRMGTNIAASNHVSLTYLRELPLLWQERASQRNPPRNAWQEECGCLGNRLQGAEERQKQIGCSYLHNLLVTVFPVLRLTYRKSTNLREIAKWRP
jgi:hypothetical protein